MARKVDSTAKQAPAATPAAGADDLSILQPDGEIEIQGETIQVREYRFFDGLRLQQQHRAFFDALYDLLAPADPAAQAPTFDDVLALIGMHADSVQAMVALSIGKPAEWVGELSESDGDALLLTWWQVNSGFFVRRVMRRALQQRLEGSGSDGLGSTTS